MTNQWKFFKNAMKESKCEKKMNEYVSLEFVFIILLQWNGNWIRITPEDGFAISSFIS